MKPIEAVARGIDPDAWSHETEKDANYPAARRRVEERRRASFINARAALTALAENITPEMARSGAVAIAAAGCSDEAAVSSFRAMIAKALEDGHE